MARVKVIRNTYGGMQYLKNALNYVSDSRALYGGGYGVDLYNANNAYDQMLATRQYFGKLSGNPLVHIIIAYNDSVKDLITAARYGQECAKHFSDRFQVLYCTHAKDFHCGKFHTHIIINAVSYINGQMIQTGYDEMNAFCSYVSQVTGQRSWFYFDNKAQ